MKISLSTHLVLYYDPCKNGLLHTISEYGFQRVELWAMKPHFPYNNPQGVEALRALGASEGIEFYTAHLPMYEMIHPAGRPEGLFSPSSENPDIRKKWKSETGASARAAAAIGAKYLTLHTDLRFPGPNPRFEIARDSLGAFIEEDLPPGAALSLENDAGGAVMIDGLLSLIDGFDPSRIGITLDLGHALVGGDVVSAIHAAGNRLNVIHAHDNDGLSDQHLPPGRGKMPWDKVARALKEVDFDGAFVWEIRDPTAGRDTEFNSLREILREINAFGFIK